MRLKSESYSLHIIWELNWFDLWLVKANYLFPRSCINYMLAYIFYVRFVMSFTYIDQMPMSTTFSFLWQVWSCIMFNPFDLICDLLSRLFACHFLILHPLSISMHYELEFLHNSVAHMDYNEPRQVTTRYAPVSYTHLTLPTIYSV